jgi:hypothetical protein
MGGVPPIIIMANIRGTIHIPTIKHLQDVVHIPMSKTRGDHWAKIVEQRAIKIGSNIFIVGKFCKNITCKRGDFKIVKHVYM